MNKLKIYACSGVGDAENELTPYWSNDTSDLSNTQAVNGMLASVNELNVELRKLNLTEAQRIERYNKIDVLVVVMLASTVYADDAEKLQRAGRVISAMYAAGEFNFASVSDLERDEHLTALEDAVFDTVNNGGDAKLDPEFYAWYKANVLECNKVGLTEKEQRAIEGALRSVSGIGATTQSLSEMLQEGGKYLMYYVYIPQEKWSKLPSDIVTKIRGQKKVYTYIMRTYKSIYGSEENVLKVIRASFIDYYGTTPEEATKQLLTEKGVGLATEVIVALIGAAVTVLCTLIPVIVSACQAKQSAQADAQTVALYTAPSQDEVIASCPAAKDWDKDAIKQKQSGGSNKLLLIGAALLAFLMLKK